MELHLINGFLGAGKTTAIIAAVRYLIGQGKTVGIVTNDKGKFQVDTAFFQLNSITTRQVTGGCFRCSFTEFEEKITQLQNSSAVDIIFAESVGSCVDLVNTIFSPLQQNIGLNFEKLTFSVFTDIRLFQRWLQNVPLPFSEAIIYLFVKQIEEGNYLILNKADLLSPSEQKEVRALALEKFPQKRIFLQDSRDQTGVLPWLTALEDQEVQKGRQGFMVDYPTYKGGENEMAWLDQKMWIESQSPQMVRSALIQLISLLLNALQKEEVFVGHIKFLLSSPQGGTKLSFTTADLLNKPISSEWETAIPDLSGHSILVMLNARISMRAEDFAKIVNDAISQVTIDLPVQIKQEQGSSYNPQMSMKRP